MYFSNKLNFKKIRSNKIISFLLYFLIIIILISLITIPKMKRKTSTNTYKIINVLEIEPGNLFRLTDGYEYNGYKLQVTKVDMPTFISTISPITGDYDVVYIGRDNEGLAKEWNTNYTYRDYTAPFTQEWGPALSGDYGSKDPDKDYRNVTQSIWYGTMGLYDYVAVNKISYFNILRDGAKSGHVVSKINGEEKTFYEYYPENDITNKKAKQILNMINSNQLVYIDNSILNDSTLSTTKLANNFSNCNKDNFKKVSYLNNEDLINDYLNLDINKRPDVTLVNSPSGDTDEELDSNLDNRLLKFDFNLNNVNSNTKYNAKLYLDFNEDGLFEGDGSGNSENDECVYILDNLQKGTNTIKYKLFSSFVGYLNWKIEVYDTSNEFVCTNLYGSAIFKNLNNERQTIKVLQVAPNTHNNLDLSEENTIFHDNIKDLKDYDIQVTFKKISEFNTLNAENVANEYDMIILGFCDGYGNDDGTPISQNGLKIIDEFNKKNKSIMLSHDTIGTSILGSTKLTANGYNYNVSRENSNYLLSQKLKDLAGQCWYNSDPFVNNNAKPYNNFIDNKTTLGATAYSSLKLYWDYTKTEKIKKINSAQITSYPYSLSDSINIATTHCQWYQINLENDKLVPWFNLSTNNINSGDSRNFYYTYSIKNITYTGSGNAAKTDEPNGINSGYTDDEMKLFVNTIIKAIMGANKKPEVTNKIYENQDDLTNPFEIDDNGDAGTISDNNDYNFAVNIYDVDAANNEDMKLTAVVVPESVSNKEAFSYNGRFEICNDKNVLYKHNGIDTTLKIPNSYLAENANNNLKVVVKAKDGHDAVSDIKSFKLSVDTKTKVYHGVFNTDNENSNNGKWTEDLINSYIDSSVQSEKYNTIVPFASLIHVYNSNIDIELTIDKLFSMSNDGVNAAYSDDTHPLPTIYYINNNNSLTLLGTLTNDYSNVYEYHLNNTDVNNISSNGLLNNGFCNLVIKYYGKTYNKPSDNNSLYYKNTVQVFKNQKELNYGDAQIYVPFKELVGNLF